MTFVILAPYLEVDSRFRVGPWELIPAPSFAAEDALSPEAHDQARGLLELYHRSPRVRSEFGCFLRRGTRPVGQPMRTFDLVTVRRALLVGLLDVNPAPPGRGGEQYGGHGVWTSDNVEVLGHEVSPEGYVSARYGLMTQSLVMGLRIGEQHSEIAPPIEVPFPLLGRSLDKLYADAAYQVLRPDTDSARRLAQAIDWLDLAWRNSPSTTQNMRILMLKSGFEVLLNRGDRLDRQRPALESLLARRRARRRLRAWLNRAGQVQQERMTDIGWWFTQFTFLRNAIAHGEDVGAGNHRFGRTYHLWLGEYYLREAIKETVAVAGNPLVRLDPFDRALHQALAAVGAL